MISIKTKEEIKNITRSCEILALAKKKVYDAMVPGVSALELNEIFEKEIKAHGAQSAFQGYHGFKGSLCISFNEEMIHGIPSNRKIKKNDIVKIDSGCVYKGMYSDSAFTKIIGDASPRDKEMVKVAEESFWAGVNAIKPGARVGDISHAIGQVVKKHGFFVPQNFSGHGIGKALHEDPYIFNEGIPGTGPLLKDGMVICIEPMILQKSNRVRILKDDWTVVSLEGLNTAHYEHTVLIKDGYPVVLTEGI